LLVVSLDLENVRRARFPLPTVRDRNVSLAHRETGHLST